MALTQIAADDEIVAAILADPEVGHTEAASKISALGHATSDTSVRRYRRDKIDFTPAPSTAVHEADADVEALEERVAALQADNRRLFQQAARYKRKGEEMVEAVYRAARDAAEYVGTTPAVSIPRPRDSAENRGEVALWHITDWQGGKRTESYDRTIMRERVQTFVDKAIKVTEIQRADHPVDEATILITGDMVEGVSIFPGQVWELDGTLFEQMFDVADLLEWTIRRAAQEYATVNVVAEWGNHGRIGTKHDGIKASDNVDRMVYNIVKQRLGDSVASFQTSGQWYQHFSIGAYRAVAIHGDEIKSFGGNLPAYGILRKANSWASGVLPSFKDLYIGHYHQSMQVQMANGGSVFMTGSTESDNLYAAEFVAATGAPSQRVNFIDPRAGRVTAEYRLWV